MVKGIENIASKTDISNSVDGLIQCIRKCNSDIIKWMFFFQISQTIAIWAIFYKVTNHKNYKKRVSNP